MATTKTVTLELAPETQDICDFALKAVKQVKAKKPLTDLLPEVIKVVDGIANVPTEASTKPWVFATTLVLFGVSLAQELVATDVVAVPGKV